MPKATIEYPDNVVSRKGNLGWHRKGKRAYRKAVETIYRCLLTYREARLYHLCFEGQSHKTQMKMLNGLVQIADRAGIKLEWFACREVADSTKKAHIHAFVIIDAKGINPYRVFNQFDDGQVAELCARHGVNFSIFSPKDDLGIHGNTDYMTLPYQGPGNKQTARGQERLKDALRWLSYAFKARSKPLEEEADGQLFPASRPNRKRKTSLSPAAPIAAEEVVFDAEGEKVVSHKVMENPAAEEEVVAKAGKNVIPNNAVGNQSTQQEEIQNERKLEAQTSASSQATTEASSSGPNTGQGSSPAASSEAHGSANEFFGESKKLPGCQLVNAEAQQQGSSGRARPNREGIKVNLTPAEKYIAGLYEEAVDLGLDIHSMRSYLLSHGVKRTPLQLEDELENTYGFYDYAASHPPKQMMSVREWDRAVDKGMTGLLVRTGRTGSLVAELGQQELFDKTDHAAHVWLTDLVPICV